MLKGLVIAVCIILLLGIIFIISKLLVSKRLWLAKRCIIGRDSPEEVEKLKNLAKEMFTNETFNMPDAEEYELSIELTKRKHKITEVMIETKKTIVICSSEEPEPSVFHKGTSELGATFFVYIGLLSVLFAVAFCLTLLIGSLIS